MKTSVAGRYHSLGMDDTGAVWAWGNNDHGQLGDGSNSDSSTPVAVKGLAEDEERVSGLDWTDLPTFGGSEPQNTVGVWSWDSTRLLVGSCGDDLEIVGRGMDKC